MTEKTQASSLEELQQIDESIRETEDKIRDFDTLLDEVAEPAAALAEEATSTRSRLKEMQVEERRLELTAQEKRARVGKLKERLDNVRNVREQSAVSAELELVEQALEGDEQEALTLLDQMRKLELRLEDQERELVEARAEVEPRRQQLVSDQERMTRELEELRTRRQVFAASLEPRELRMYESIRRSSGRRAVSRLTPDGACGNCFSVIPLQLQNEIRHGAEMVRCEACGVIITAADTRQEGDEEE